MEDNFFRCFVYVLTQRCNKDSIGCTSRSSQKFTLSQKFSNESCGLWYRQEHVKFNTQYKNSTATCDKNDPKYHT